MYCKKCEIEWKLLSKCPICDYKKREQGETKEFKEFESIKKCSFTKDDIIIITYKGELSDDQVSHIKKGIKMQLPDNKILLLEGGLELSVLTKGD